MNSILIYLATGFIDWEYTSEATLGWLGQLVGTPYDTVVMVFSLLAVQWAFLYFLYKQKVFLKV